MRSLFFLRLFFHCFCLLFSQTVSFHFLNKHTYTCNQNQHLNTKIYLHAPTSTSHLINVELWLFYHLSILLFYCSSFPSKYIHIHIYTYTHTYHTRINLFLSAHPLHTLFLVSWWPTQWWFDLIANRETTHTYMHTYIVTYTYMQSFVRYVYMCGFFVTNSLHTHTYIYIRETHQIRRTKISLNIYQSITKSAFKIDLKNRRLMKIDQKHYK